MTLSVALYRPEIPPNTGNIARLCAATNTPLHIIGSAGFRMDERTVRRAGLDYWPYVQLTQHLEMDAFVDAHPTARILYVTTKARHSYTSWDFRDDDCLLFGPETRGLPEEWLHSHPETCITIPMLNDNVRSLNLATAVSIILYEALRQLKKF